MEFNWAISNPKRWCCESATLNMPANLENSAVAAGLESVRFHSNQKKCNAKECSNYHTIVFISHAGKVVLQILQARPQHYVNQELSDVQDRFWKGRGNRNQTANIHWITDKARELQKKLLLLHWLLESLGLCGSKQTVENSSRDGNTRPPYLLLVKHVCR